jgi:hypothetical protein
MVSQTSFWPVADVWLSVNRADDHGLTARCVCRGGHLAE